MTPAQQERRARLIRLGVLPNPAAWPVAPKKPTPKKPASVIAPPPKPKQTVAMAAAAARAIVPAPERRRAPRIVKSMLSVLAQLPPRSEPSLEAAITPPLPGIHQIIARIAGMHGLTSNDLKSHRRGRLVPVRQLAMYLCREVAKKSFPQIGRLFGFDHSTCHHAHNQILSRIKRDNNFAAEVRCITAALCRESEPGRSTGMTAA